MAKKKELKYSEAVIEIEEILQSIENDELDIDVLSEKIKQVSELVKYCKKKLKQTESDIQQIIEEIED